jgi:lipopolysaccharide transport system permease protein
MHDRSDPPVVFDASPALRHPRRILEALRADLRVSLDLVPQMTRRQIVARYRQSTLGLLWLFLGPLSTAAAWLFLRASGALPLGDAGASYPLYVITGLFLWQGFLRMLNAPLQQVNASRQIISKVRCPWEAIIAAGWSEALFEFAIYVVVLLVLTPLLGQELGAGMLRAILPAIALLLLGAAIGLFLLPLGLLFEDVPRIVGVATMFLFFVTPIVYRPVSTALGEMAVRWNPVAVFLDAARTPVVGGVAAAAGLVAPWALAAVVLFLVGWCLLRIAVPHLVARL